MLICALKSSGEIRVWIEHVLEFLREHDTAYVTIFRDWKKGAKGGAGNGSNNNNHKNFANK